MCCLCFSRFSTDELHEDEEGTWDVCKPCQAHEDEVKKGIARGECVCLQFRKGGICRHVIPFLPKNDVEASEDYL